MDQLNPPKHRLRTALITGLKLLIAVLGLCYVISRISWHDRVFIASGTVVHGITLINAAPVKLLGWHQGAAQVSLHNCQVTVRLATGQVVTGLATRPPLGLPKTLSLSPHSLVYMHGHMEIKRGLRRLILDAHPWPLLAALLLLGVPTFITTWRWQKLLLVQDLLVSYGKCLQLTFVGQFYSTFLPGSISGDVVKVIYTGRITSQPTKSAVTVLLDRVIGLMALIIVAAVAVAAVLTMNLLSGQGSTATADPLLIHILCILGALLAALAAGAVVYFSSTLRHQLGVQALLNRLPRLEFLTHADRTLRVYRRHWRLMGLLLMVSMVSQAMLPVAGWLIGQAFAMRAPFGNYIAYLPLVVLAVSLPIVPPGGLGVLDSLLLYFFVTCGVDNANQAFALAQGLRFMPLFWGMIGGYWVICGRFPRPQGKHLGDMAAKMAAPPTAQGGRQPLVEIEAPYLLRDGRVMRLRKAALKVLLRTAVA